MFNRNANTNAFDAWASTHGYNAPRISEIPAPRKGGKVVFALALGLVAASVVFTVLPWLQIGGVL